MQTIYGQTEKQQDYGLYDLIDKVNSLYVEVFDKNESMTNIYIDCPISETKNQCEARRCLNDLLKGHTLTVFGYVYYLCVLKLT